MARHDGHAVFSRAYVLFKTPEVVMEFRQAYDGHVFRSKTGQFSEIEQVERISDCRRRISGGCRVLANPEDSAECQSQGGWQAGDN
jgi:hypothetical protein